MSTRNQNPNRSPGRKGTVPILSTLANTPTIPETVYERLPEPIRRVLPLFARQTDRDVFITACLGLLSACLPNVWGWYDMAKFSAHLFICIIAPPGSGKGFLSLARKLGNGVEELLLEEYLKKLREAEDADASGEGGLKEPDEPSALAASEPQECNVAPGGGGGAEEQPLDSALPATRVKKPKHKTKRKQGEQEEHPILRRLFVSGDISSSGLIEALHGNGGFGLIFETEIDSLVKAQKQDWGGTSDTLRKAHGHETVSFQRVGARHIVVHNPTVAFVIAGTPKQILRLITSPEDGLYSRVTFYGFLPSDPTVWKDVRPRVDRPDPDILLYQGSLQVRQLWSILESRGKHDPLMVELAPHQWDLFNEWMGAVAEHLFVRHEYTGSSTAYRAGVLIFRLAMLLAVWQAFEEGVDLTTARTVAVQDEAFRAALTLGLTYTQHSLAIMGAYPREETAPLTEDEHKLLNALPQEFERTEALRVALEQGVPERTLDRRLSEWTKKGVVKRLRKGAYRKLERQNPSQ